MMRKTHLIQRSALIGIIIFVSLVVVFASWKTASAASAGAYNGYLPGSISGCSSNVRAGSVASLYTDTAYYGWAEQRYSSSGSCYGYQWIRLHVTVKMTYESPYGVVREHEVGGKNYTDSFEFSTPGGYLNPGTYDLPILYVTSYRICAQMVNVDLSDIYYFFGHSYAMSNDDGNYDWCA